MSCKNKQTNKAVCAKRNQVPNLGIVSVPSPVLFSGLGIHNAPPTEGTWQRSTTQKVEHSPSFASAAAGHCVCVNTTTDNSGFRDKRPRDVLRCMLLMHPVWAGRHLFACLSVVLLWNRSWFCLSFITFRSARHLDGKHTVFGRVVGGLDVIDKLEKVPTDKSDKPKVSDSMRNIKDIFRPSATKSGRPCGVTHVSSLLLWRTPSHPTPDPLYPETPHPDPPSPKIPSTPARSLGLYADETKQTCCSFRNVGDLYIKNNIAPIENFHTGLVHMTHTFPQAKRPQSGSDVLLSFSLDIP